MGSPVLDQEQAEAQDGHPPASQSLLDSMRAYRACLNCRNRKSKCDLDPNGGKPVSRIISLPSMVFAIEHLIIRLSIVRTASDDVGPHASGSDDDHLQQLT